MMFFEWLKKASKKEKLTSVEKDFFGDVLRDKDFRDFKSAEELERYLRFKKACRPALNCGLKFFKKYKAEVLDKKKIDGISAKDKMRIRSALRDVWRYSHPWKLVTTRCLLPDGFSKCELCKKKCPKVFVDHIEKVGDVDAGIIFRMFVPSTKMQGLCKKCHDAKTKKERADARPPKKEKPMKDFF